MVSWDWESEWTVIEFHMVEREGACMSRECHELLTDALELPVSERGELAARVIESLDPIVDDDAASAWESEISRRLSEIDGGTVEMIPWEDARRIIRGSTDEASGD